MTTVKDCLEDLLALDSGLAPWEVDFVERMSNKDSFNDWEVGKIFEIYDLRCLVTVRKSSI